METHEMYKSLKDIIAKVSKYDHEAYAYTHFLLQNNLTQLCKSCKSPPKWNILGGNWWKSQLKEGILAEHSNASMP